MAKRVAFFASKDELEQFYNLETNKQSLFEPHYNLSPGHQLPVLTFNEDELEIHQFRWGRMGSKQAEQTVIEKQNVVQELGNRNASRCILPLSGFFVWKDDKEKNHPFFVRMLNNGVMSIAGLLYDDDQPFVSMITTEANTLVQPMSSRMPLMLNRTKALQWLQSDMKTKDILEETDNLFMLTDLSVLRVSKKVNDPTNNKPEIIQPIPK